MRLWYHFVEAAAQTDGPAEDALCFNGMKLPHVQFVIAVFLQQLCACWNYLTAEAALPGIGDIHAESAKSGDDCASPFGDGIYLPCAVSCRRRRLASPSSSLSDYNASLTPSSSS